MAGRTVDWAAFQSPAPDAARTEGLRERKKRQMRQKLSDAATEMFLERGFDAVRVSEVAEACGVSEKTVYNYFATKESLLLDRSDATMSAIRAALADASVLPLDAAQRVLHDELRSLTTWLAGQDDVQGAVSLYQRFGELINTTPALRAHQRDMTDRLIAVTAELLAERYRMSPGDPEPQIAATALIGLWQIQFQSLRTHMQGHTPQRVQGAVSADVARAARLLDSGFAAMDSGCRGG